MRLITRDGWLLTDITTNKLMEQFDGTEEELITYVSSRTITRDPFNLNIYADDNVIAERTRYFIGIYELTANEKGEFGTKPHHERTK